MSEQAIDVNVVKGQLINIVRTQYKNFIEGLHNIPLEPNLKNNALFFFDTAFLHLREAVAMAEVVVTPVEPESIDDSASQATA